MKYQMMMVLAGILVLSGCATSKQERPSSYDRYVAKMGQASDKKLLVKYHNQTRMRIVDPVVFAEIERRELIRPTMWESINARMLQVGMNHYEMIAAWGRPKYNIHRLVRGDTYRVWVFDADIPRLGEGNNALLRAMILIAAGEDERDRYCYTLNGVVTTWED